MPLTTPETQSLDERIDALKRLLSTRPPGHDLKGAAKELDALMRFRASSRTH